MGYSVGNLELSIIGNSDSAVKSIHETAKALNSLSNSLNKLNSSQTVFAAEKLELLFRNIASATNAINGSAISNLANVGKALNNITNLSKLEKLDFTKIAKGFTVLTFQITPFVDKIKEAENGLTALYGLLQKSGKAASILSDPTGEGSGKKGGGVDKLFNLGKITAYFYMAKRVGKVVADIVQSGADYGETLNLWRVSMGEFNETATSFVNKMNEAYGISEKTLMNAQATFKNMLGSLGGISDQMAYNLSESVTKMAIDYSSLYNVAMEDAMEKFQSALSGQVRPVRSVSGYDITENTLYQLYQSIGGTKTVRQLNQTEKRLLAIYAIFNQMEASGAINDMDRTINSFANQSRIMSETFEETKQYAGLLVTNLLDSLGIMTSINAVLSFTAETLKALATYFDAIPKQEMPSFEDTANSAEDASKAIDDVKGKLMGFDQFRSLSGTEEDDVAIDQALANAVSTYTSQIGNANLESKELARTWLENIGLFYDSETSTYEMSEDFKEIADIVPIISGGLLGVLGLLGSKGIAGMVSSLGGSFTGLGSIIKGAFNIKGLGILAIIAALYYLYTTNEDFRESIDELFTVVMDALVSLMPTVMAIIDAVVPFLEVALDILGDILPPLIDIVTNVIKLLTTTGLLEPILIVLAGSLLGPIGAVVAFISVLPNAIKSLIENWDVFVSHIKDTGKSILNFFGDLIEGVVNGFVNLVNLVVGLINDFISGVNDVVAYLGWKPINPITLHLEEVDWFADGGMPDKGSMFVAGEAGAEIVYNNSNGQSGVANIQQIAQATYQGTMSALRDWWGGMGAKGDIPHLEEANATGMYQAVTSVANSYGNTWSKV